MSSGKDKRVGAVRPVFDDSATNVSAVQVVGVEALQVEGVAAV